jgi:hypothetical protein
LSCTQGLPRGNEHLTIEAQTRLDAFNVPLGPKEDSQPLADLLSAFPSPRAQVSIQALNL